MAPPVPTLAVTAFGMVQPDVQLRLDTVGCVCPLGHTLRYETAFVCVTVTLSSTASAESDTDPVVTSRLRIVPATQGVLNGPTWNAGRESKMRVGDCGWK